MEKKKSFAFGYLLNIYVGLMFLASASLTAGAASVVVPALVAKYGWDYSATVSVSSIGGFFGVIAAILISQLVKKKGNRLAIFLTYTIGGLAACFCAHFKAFGVYVVLFIIVMACSNAGTVLTGTLTANWFPRKKGIMLGFSSIGFPASSIIVLPLVNFLIPKIGISWAMTVIGCYWIVVGILAYVWARERPEDIGLAPDGDYEHIDEINAVRKQMMEYESPWTIKRLLKSGTVWMQGIVYGGLSLAVIGCVAQMVGYFIEKGVPLGTAVTIISLSNVVGIVGSICWGVLDQKLGTKKATIIYGIFVAISFVLVILAKNIGFVWVAAMVCGFANGGIGNLPQSMQATAFGRWDMPAASRVINPIITLIKALPFAIIGICSSIYGTIGSAYYVFLIITVICTILCFFMPNKMVGKEG